MFAIATEVATLDLAAAIALSRGTVSLRWLSDGLGDGLGDGLSDRALVRLSLNDVCWCGVVRLFDVIAGALVLRLLNFVRRALIRGLFDLVAGLLVLGLLNLV